MGIHEQKLALCKTCQHQFAPEVGTTRGGTATCRQCSREFKILKAVNGNRPSFRLYGKLVLTSNGEKKYLPSTKEDWEAYQECSYRLRKEVQSRVIVLPTLELKDGYNTRQAMSYGFHLWRDFFNDRQLLALGLLQGAIAKITDKPARDALLTLFSGVLEFNNMFASYKGEGTGAVRHMFAHHILKPERTPIEANVWGTSKSSGSLSNLFRSRLIRAAEYRLVPTEVNGFKSEKGVSCSDPFTGRIETTWPKTEPLTPRGVYLSCGDSANTSLPAGSIDYIVTDPPFFDNVHYSELADFFFSWQQLLDRKETDTTRSPFEVQDATPKNFSIKLQGVFRECHRVLKDDGLLVFTYHHSREEGWKALADAVLGADFFITNSHPVRGEMSVAVPKSQAKEPIQIDIVLVCCKSVRSLDQPTFDDAIEAAKEKIRRLRACGLKLSKNDIKVVFFGQLLTTLRSPTDTEKVAHCVIHELQILEQV